MKMFTLYIGAGSEEEITLLLGRRFESFTLQEGHGVFRGQRERMWLVKIATLQPARVIEAAEEIRTCFNQEGVGIEFAGNYHRVTGAEAASQLKTLQEFK